VTASSDNWGGPDPIKASEEYLPLPICRQDSLTAQCWHSRCLHRLLIILLASLITQTTRENYV